MLQIEIYQREENLLKFDTAGQIINHICEDSIKNAATKFRTFSLEKLLFGVYKVKHSLWSSKECSKSPKKARNNKTCILELFLAPF